MSTYSSVGIVPVIGASVTVTVSETRRLKLPLRTKPSQTTLWQTCLCRVSRLNNLQLCWKSATQRIRFQVKLFQIGQKTTVEATNALVIVSRISSGQTQNSLTLRTG
jgi:hypothetical protein